MAMRVRVGHRTNTAIASSLPVSEAASKAYALARVGVETSAISRIGV